jgi:cytoskeleton protein RodZ
MSEKLQTDPVPLPVDSAQPKVSAGTLLRAARQAQGLHIGALAVMLKVPVPKLEALEADRFEALLDRVFTRALASSVCRALKIDPIPVLAALPQPEAAIININQDSLNTPFQTQPFTWVKPLTRRLASPLSLGVAVMVLAVLVILNWPDAQAEDALAGGSVLVPQTSADPVPPMPEVPASGEAGAPGSASLVAALNEVPLVTAPSPTAPVASSNAVSSDGVLLLQARQQSWVGVTDAGGVLQMQRILQPGESVQLAGALPLAVVLGRADAVDVTVRGERLDVNPMTNNNNVARFEVK